MAKEAIFALFAIFLRNFKQIKENLSKGYVASHGGTLHHLRGYRPDVPHRQKTMLRYASRRGKKEEIEKHKIDYAMIDPKSRTLEWILESRR